MDYIWNENYPIAIHITEGDYTPAELQSLANHDDLVVRDLRDCASPRKVYTDSTGEDYYPESL